MFKQGFKVGFGAKIKLDQADRVFSCYIRTRDNWTCQRCRKPYPENCGASLQASHFQSRRKEATRYDERNVDALCAGCHMYFTGNPGEHYQWQVSKKGQAVIDKLILQSNSYVKKDRKMALLYWRQRLMQDFGKSL